PRRREAPVDGAGAQVGQGRASDPLPTPVNQCGRRSLEEGAERPAGRLLKAGLVEGARHGGQPCVSLGRADREAAMGLPQAERPADARVLRWAASKLGEVGGKLPDRFEELLAEERPQDGVLLYLGVEEGRQLYAALRAAEQ